MVRKLTADIVRKIRTSTVHGAALAKQFGVDRATILQIRKGETWRHVEPKVGIPWVVIVPCRTGGRRPRVAQGAGKGKGALGW
jgi:hypothetical protein